MSTVIYVEQQVDLSAYPACPTEWGVALYGTSDDDAMRGWHFTATAWKQSWSYVCDIADVSPEARELGYLRIVNLSETERLLLIERFERDHAIQYQSLVEAAKDSLRAPVCTSCTRRSALGKECQSCGGRGYKPHPMWSREFSAGSLSRFVAWLETVSGVHTLSPSDEELRRSERPIR